MKSYDDLYVEDATSPTRSPALSMRPDTALMKFRCRVNHEDPVKAIELLRAGITLLTQYVHNLEPNARVDMRDVDFVRLSKSVSKVRKKSSRVERITLSGRVWLPLAESDDFWARARRVARLQALAEQLRREAAEQDPPIYVAFKGPFVRVLDPEPYRQVLIERWVGYARAIADIAQSSDAPLHIVECIPGITLIQKQISFEEVELRLKLEGRLDTRPARRAEG